MRPAARGGPSSKAPKLMQVRVLGPDRALAATDVARLFQDSLPGDSRERLARWPRFVTACGEQITGVAVYRIVDDDLRVPDIGVDRDCQCSARDILNALLDALELACQASGCARIVILPPADLAPALLARRGYTMRAAGCGGAWLEKTFASGTPAALLRG